MINDMRHNLSFEEIAKKHKTTINSVIVAIGDAWDKWQVERNLEESAYGIGIREMVEENMFSLDFIAIMFSVKRQVLDKTLATHNIKVG